VVLAGPNGAGKSTLYKQRIAPRLKAPFVNADIIQRDELQDPAPGASYKAARIVEKRCRDLIGSKKSFVTETVFSHRSKLDLIKEAKAAGFRVMILHIGVGHPDLSVARVAERVREGGHDVPEDKIRARAARNGPLIRQAVHLADTAHIFDNSKLNQPPERMVTFSGGTVAYVAGQLPRWIIEIYRDDLWV